MSIVTLCKININIINSSSIINSNKYLYFIENNGQRVWNNQTSVRNVKNQV